MHKTILITGATSGIGRATALLLASQGHRVFATGRNTEALEELRVEASRQGWSMECLQLDVTDRSQLAEVQGAISAATDGAGVDVLVNNAGFGIMAPVSEVDESDLRGQFDTNVFGLVAVTQTFLPRMRERGRGRVINVSSVGGRVTLPLLGTYNATKYAVESLSDALRAEVAADGIDVVLIEPGVINTNFTRHASVAIEKQLETDSPYAPALQRAEQLIAGSVRMGVPPERIARVIAAAIGARRPRARYVAPFSAWFGLFLASVFPTRWVDAVLRRVYGLDRATRPALRDAEHAAG